MSVDLLESVRSHWLPWLIVLVLATAPTNWIARSLIFYVTHRILHVDKPRQPGPSRVLLLLVSLKVGWTRRGLSARRMIWAVGERVDENTQASFERTRMVYVDVVRAGPWTGSLERAIVILLTVVGAYAAVAWIMVGKSIILQFLGPRRAGPVAPSPDKTADEQDGLTSDLAHVERQTYLVGTLFSFLVGLLAGLVLQTYSTPLSVTNSG